MPDEKPAVSPIPVTRPVGTSFCARTWPRPLKRSVARTITPTKTIIAETSLAMTSLGSAAAKKGPMKAPTIPPATSGARDSFREVAHAIVRAGGEGDHQHLQEERDGGSEACVDADQQQARHQHAAVHANRRRRQARGERDERAVDDGRVLAGRGQGDRGEDRDDRRQRQRHAGYQRAPARAGACRKSRQRIVCFLHWRGLRSVALRFGQRLSRCLHPQESTPLWRFA